MTVRWTRRAVRDVETHVAYLDQVNPQAARTLAVALIEAGDSLVAMPRRGRPGRVPGTRELLAVSPYVIVYEINGNDVTILRIWHGRLVT